jgi:hypothetical protein
MQMRASLLILIGLTLLVPVATLAREIHLPAEGALFGHVVIADWFTKIEKGVVVAREFQAWPGDRGWRSADWFDGRIEAHPGDVIVLSPGTYKVDIWVYTPNLTITTEPDEERLAEIWGTLEIDADRVTLDRIAVTGARKEGSSGHGIEINREFVNRMTLRDCRSENNEWTGVHLIGPRGEIQELCLERCQIAGNGLDGLDAQSIQHLVLTECQITGNGWNNPVGVGVRVGSYMGAVDVRECEISENAMDGLSAKACSYLYISDCTIVQNGKRNEEGVGIRIGTEVKAFVEHDNVVSQNRFANVYYEEEEE